MAVELITGHAGTNHISSEDEAFINYHLYDITPHWVGEVPEIELVNANTLVIGKGVFYFNGRFFVFSSPETVTIKSGAQGQTRKDGVWLRYQRDSNGVETGSVVVIDGDPASPKDTLSPYYTPEGEFSTASTIDFLICNIVVDSSGARVNWKQGVSPRNNIIMGDLTLGGGWNPAYGGPRPRYMLVGDLLFLSGDITNTYTCNPAAGDKVFWLPGLSARQTWQRAPMNASDWVSFNNGAGTNYVNLRIKSGGGTIPSGSIIHMSGLVFQIDLTKQWYG